MLTALLLSLTLSTGSPAPTTTQQPKQTAQVAPGKAMTATELRLALRDLWSGHIFWVRSYVLASHYNDLKGAAAADAKVVSNARSIADAIAPLYGKEAADKLFGLLAGHYGAVKDYMAATYKGDGQGQGAATQKLMQNADEIATFLSGANPNLPHDAVLSLLQAHGSHHVQQINDIQKQDFAAEATNWDAMQAHMNTIADALADALVKQFPDQFAAR